MTRVIINGSKGRMGQALLSCAALMPELEIVGAVDQGDDLAALLPKADVVIEFSFHSVTWGVAELCSKHGKPLVIGTTGHSAEDKAKIVALGSRIPMVMATNFSTGVNTLFWLTRKAAEILGIRSRSVGDASSFEEGCAERHSDDLAGDPRRCPQGAVRGSIAARSQRHHGGTHERRNRHPRHSWR